MANIKFDPGDIVFDRRGDVGVILPNKKLLMLAKQAVTRGKNPPPVQLLENGPTTRPMDDQDIQEVDIDLKKILHGILISHELPSPFHGSKKTQTRSKDHDARKAMLEKFRDDYPKWTDVVTMAIFNGTSDAILPARESSLLDGGAEERDLVLLEPGVKGPPAIFRYEGIEITCINYSGSYDPMSAKEFLQVIGQANYEIAKLPDPETWIQGFVK